MYCLRVMGRHGSRIRKGVGKVALLAIGVGAAGAGAGHAETDQLVTTAVDHGSGSVVASRTVPAAVLSVPPGIQTVEVVTAAELAAAVTEGESEGNEVNEHEAAGRLRQEAEVAAESGGRAVRNAGAVRV